MTTSTIKSPVHHETFVKAPEIKQEKIEKLIEAHGLDQATVVNFFKAVNWILKNDNSTKSMKFFKSYQNLVDAKLAVTFEHEEGTFLKLTQKAYKIINGYTPKIKVSKEPRSKVKQSKGYKATEQIPQELKDLLERTGYTVRRSKLKNAYYTIWVRNQETKKIIEIRIYESVTKFLAIGSHKEEILETFKTNLGDMVISSKMAFTFGYVLVDNSSLPSITKEMLDLSSINSKEETEE